MIKWREIRGFKNYEISNDGCIRNIKFNRLLKPWKHSAGYYQIELCENGQTKKLLIHRLIAEAFIPNPENKECINHINGIKTDNRISNLEWCSKAENNIKARNVLGVAMKKVVCINTGITYRSIKEASKATGVSASSISQICSKAKNSAKGMKFITA